MSGPVATVETPFTAEQLAAVEREGDLLLAANAGSGKTRVMVERFVRAVVDEGVPPATIVAVTFTEKAAAELKQRIRAALLARGARREAREAEAAPISTIHGLCARLLRAYAVEAGIDPEFGVLDEVEAERLTRQAYGDALDAVAERDPAALDVVAAYGVARLRDVLTGVHALLRSRGERAPRLPEAPAVDVAGARAALLAARDAAAAELAGAALGQSVDAAREALERCRTLVGAPAAEDGAALALEPLKVPRTSAALRTPTLDAYRDALDAFATSCAGAAALPAYAHLAELLAAFGERYAELKRARSAVDFEDLELLALGLLDGSPAFAARAAGRIERMLVDEFQDTNPVQLALVDHLASGNLVVVGDEFQSIYGFRHADVALFRERRHRLAAQDRVAELRANFRSAPELLSVLNRVFAPRLGEGFLALEPAPGAARCGDGPRVELLVTDRGAWTQDGAPGLGAALSGIALARLAEARLLAQRLRELVDEGRRPGEIAVLLRAMTDAGIYERALEEQGVATYVIGGRGYWEHRQVQDVMAYLTALANPRAELRLHEALASPLAGVSSDGLAQLALSSQALRRDPWWTLEEAYGPGGDGSGDLRARLPAADDPVLSAFHDRLARDRRDAPRLALDDLIDRLVRETGYDLAVLGLPGGQRRLANVRKLMRLARAFEARAGRDLRAFVAEVEDLTRRDRPPPREGEAAIEGEGLGAVRIMTVHRAKGLEFGVVAVADLGRGRPAPAEVLRVAPDGRVGMRLVRLRVEGGGVPVFAQDELLAEQEAAAAAEEQRLFYVAMTRARDRLILSGVTDTEKWPEPAPRREPLTWIARAMLGEDPAAALSLAEPIVDVAVDGDRESLVRCALNRPETVGRVLRADACDPAAVPVPPAQPSLPGLEVAWADASVASGAGPPAGRSVPPPALAPPPPASAPVTRLSYSSFGAYGRCGYRWYVERVLRLPEDPLDAGAPPPIPAGRAGGLAPTVRGTIAHALLERVDPAAPALPARPDLDALAAEHGAELTDADAADLGRLVEGFGASPLRERLAAVPALLREVPFAFELTPAAPGVALGATPVSAPVVVHGVIDAFAREGDAALVVDYKTDRVGDADLPAHVERDYGVQRLVYALAALRTGAREVEVVHLFLERPGEPVSVVHRAAGAAALSARLEVVAAGILARRFPVAEDPGRSLCASCPARAALCSHPPELTSRDR